MIKLIVAIGPNNLIGIGNKMAWNIPEEFKHFKETTLDSWLLMGENTFKGLPGKLPRRKICVVSPNKVDESDHQVHNTKEIIDFLETFRNKEETIFIAGGKSIYENFYKLAEELIISEVKTDVKGDVFLSLNLNNYKKELLKEEAEFKVYKYIKGEK